MWTISRNPLNGKPMRTNDGAAVITQDNADPATAIQVTVSSQTKPKRGEGWAHVDPESEAMAQAICDFLNSQKDAQQ